MRSFGGNESVLVWWLLFKKGASPPLAYPLPGSSPSSATRAKHWANVFLR